MSFVLNEMECRKGPNSRHLTSRLGEGVSLEARIFGPDAMLGPVAPRTVSLLPVAYLAAASRGRALEVNCQLSEAEWNAFLFDFIPLVNDFYDFAPVRVTRPAIHKTFVPPAAGAPHSALLFSGGVDSFYSLFKLKEAQRGPHYLVSINAGAYSNPEEWMAAFGNLDRIAASTGLPVVFIDTNFHGVFPKPHLSSHTIRNISAASLLSGLVSTLFYSGSETFREMNYAVAKQTGVMSLIDPLLLHAMHRQDISTVVYGSHVGRIEKTAHIRSSRIVQSHLDVCTSTRYQLSRGEGPLNCGECMKCLRTMFTLDALGALDQFGASFPVDAFRRNIAARFERLKSASLSLDQDVVQFWQKTRGPKPGATQG
jgi:hypothetical protein